MKPNQHCEQEVVKVRPHDTIRHAVQLMRDHGVGAVVVVNDNGDPVGSVTDRDVALAVVGDGCDPNTSVCFIMSGDLVTIEQNESAPRAVLAKVA